jgi:hypothetical protein
MIVGAMRCVLVSQTTQIAGPPIVFELQVAACCLGSVEESPQQYVSCKMSTLSAGHRVFEL